MFMKESNPRHTERTPEEVDRALQTLAEASVAAAQGLDAPEELRAYENQKPSAEDSPMEIMPADAEEANSPKGTDRVKRERRRAEILEFYRLPPEEQRRIRVTNHLAKKRGGGQSNSKPAV